jgi:subtilisin family serine protease
MYKGLLAFLALATCEELCGTSGPPCGASLGTSESVPVLGTTTQPGAQSLPVGEIVTTTVTKEVIVEVSEPRRQDASVPAQALPGAVSANAMCYIARLRSADAATVRARIEELGGQPRRIYSKHVSAIEFCTGNSDVARALAAHDKVLSIDKDSIFVVSTTQSNIPNHMYLMKHYGAYIFNNYFYDNIVFRMLQIKRVIRFFSSYEYHYTGRGVAIYLLDTAVDVTEPRLRNRSGRTQSCNLHGNLMVRLMAGAKQGFAKSASVEVLDVADCAGRARLSDILHALESIPKDPTPKVVVFGVSGPYSKLLNSVVSSLSGAGSIIVTAAGNNHDQGCYYSPGSSRTAINVGSVTKHAQVSGFSNYGGCVRTYALGEDVFEEASARGTSLSAAIVAGAAAIFLEKYPAADALQVWSYLDRNSFSSPLSRYTVLSVPEQDLDSTSSYFAYSMQGCLAFIYCLAIVFVIGLVLYYILKRYRTRKDEERLLFDIPADRF